MQKYISIFSQLKFVITTLSPFEVPVAVQQDISEHVQLLPAVQLALSIYNQKFTRSKIMFSLSKFTILEADILNSVQLKKALILTTVLLQDIPEEHGITKIF